MVALKLGEKNNKLDTGTRKVGLGSGNSIEVRIGNMAQKNRVWQDAVWWCAKEKLIRFGSVRVLWFDLTFGCKNGSKETERQNERNANEERGSWE